jgi:hypothetical protein
LISWHRESSDRLQCFRSIVVQNHATGTFDVEALRARLCVLFGGRHMSK